jgi:hypothetical protein
MVVVVVGAELEEPLGRGDASELQPMHASAHTMTTPRRSIEST